jgi:hypothetical protein
MSITGVINPAKNDRRIVVQVGDHPLSDFRKVLIFEMFDEIIYGNVRKRCKNTTIYFTTNRIPLAFVDDSTPIGKVLIYQLNDYFVVISNIFFNQDFAYSLKES